MTHWLIAPRDPLIFRDGKPFTAAPGSRAKSLAFPYPSTLAGAVRTMEGTDTSTGQFDKKRIPELYGKYIRRPLLVELDETEDIVDWLLPAPADALLFNSKSGNQVLRYSLAPVDTKGIRTDLIDLENELKIVGLSENIKEKTLPKPLRYWRWKPYRDWLASPKDGPVTIENLGIVSLHQESRTHVSVSPETQAALPGALFQTSGLEFTYLERDEGTRAVLSEAKKLALWLETDADIRKGIGFLGGERRITRWREVQTAFEEFPPDIKRKIIDERACRLILLTPACFYSGFLPEWIISKFSVHIEAAIVNRYQTISGWDYELGEPKPTRRLVPAGSVYFLKLGSDETNIKKFVDAVWMNSISDDEQDRRDGFGLALLGNWDSKLRNTEVQL